jgi:UDP-glucose 4-epimerase
MRNLITGGAGFIGSYLAEYLLKQNEKVYVIDDLSTGSIGNIEHLKKNKNFQYVIDTIMNEHLTAELVDWADSVYHLAAAVGVKLIVENPVRTIETNIQGTDIILRHASKKRKRTIVASTSEVYGKSLKVPFNEDHDMVLGPTKKGRWSYAASKIIDEFLCISYWKERKLPVTVGRFFNTVGPRQVGHYGMVVPRFLEQAMAGGPITVYGSGEQTRCFCYVGDVVEAIYKLRDIEQSYGEVYNIGSKEEISINELAELVKKMFPGNIEIKHIPYNIAYEEGFEDMMRRIPDISKIVKLLNFQPCVKIDEILNEIHNYLKNKNK